jgi:hypothetical protein
MGKVTNQLINISLGGIVAVSPEVWQALQQSDVVSVYHEGILGGGGQPGFTVKHYLLYKPESNAAFSFPLGYLKKKNTKLKKIINKNLYNVSESQIWN